MNFAFNLFKFKYVGPATRKKIVSHLIEFFFVGLIMGVSEDLLAIHFATGAQITPHVFWIAFAIALPFAIISELLVDFGVFRRFFKKRKEG